MAAKERHDRRVHLIGGTLFSSKLTSIALPAACCSLAGNGLCQGSFDALKGGQLGRVLVLRLVLGLGLCRITSLIGGYCRGSGEEQC